MSCDGSSGAIYTSPIVADFFISCPGQSFFFQWVTALVVYMRQWPIFEIASFLVHGGFA